MDCVERCCQFHSSSDHLDHYADESRPSRTSDLSKCLLFTTTLRDDLAPFVATDISLLHLISNVSDASIKLQELQEKPRTNGRQNLINTNADFQVHSAPAAEDKEFSLVVKDLTALLQTSLK